MTAASSDPSSPADVAGTPARAERAALADLLAELGPDQQTLCEGWTTRDLAAHLVVRERRPDAGPGLLLAPLSGWTARVQSGAARRDWTALVEQVRSGPPRLSMFALPGVDAAMNTSEYFIHHEDVRRAQPGWAPRPLDDAGGRALDEALWRIVRSRAKFLYKRAPVGVVLRRTRLDGSTQELTARPGTPVVSVTGPAQELLLHAFGRTAHARVATDGDANAVARLQRTNLGV